MREQYVQQWTSYGQYDDHDAICNLLFANSLLLVVTQSYIYGIVKKFQLLLTQVRNHITLYSS